MTNEDIPVLLKKLKYSRGGKLKSFNYRKEKLEGFLDQDKISEAEVEMKLLEAALDSFTEYTDQIIGYLEIEGERNKQLDTVYQLGDQFTEVAAKFKNKLKSIGESSSDESGNQQNTNQGQSSTSSTPKITIQGPPLIRDNIGYSEFEQWRESWQNYVNVTKLDKRERTEQLSVFWSYCSREFLDKLRHILEIKHGTALDLKQVLDHISEYLKGQRNLAGARYNLILRKQEFKESINDWYCALKKIALEAGLSEMSSDDWLAALIVCGATPKQEFRVGDWVGIDDPSLETWEKYGQIIDLRPDHESCLICLKNDQISWRYWRCLRRRYPPDDSAMSD